jgi:hypothetical protein
LPHPAPEVVVGCKQRPSTQDSGVNRLNR